MMVSRAKAEWSKFELLLRRAAVERGVFVEVVEVEGKSSRNGVDGRWS